MEILRISYGYLEAYKINDVIFQMDGKTFKSIRAFKNYVGKCKNLPKCSINDISIVKGATQQIEKTYNAIMEAKKKALCFF